MERIWLHWEPKELPVVEVREEARWGWEPNSVDAVKSIVELESMRGLQEKGGCFMAITIFLCYAPQDESLLQKLKAHLRVFEHQGHITLWDRGGIQPGAVWEQEVRKHLDEAQIILLLLSSSFMASYYQYTMEVRYAVVRHERQEARVIPILLRPVLWQIPPVVITRAEALLLR